MSQRILPMREALAGPYDDVRLLVLAHERRSQFRWFSIVQLFLGGVCLILCMPVILYLGVRFGLFGHLLDGGEYSGADTGGEESPRERKPRWRDSPTSWFYSYWHELRFRAFSQGRGGDVVLEGAAFPHRVQEEHAVVAAALEVADAQGLVVVESIGTAEPGEQDTVELWFGGQPLLARPEVRHEAQAIAFLREKGLEIHEAEEQLELRWKHETVGRVLAAILLLLSPVLFPFFGWMGLSLRDLWGDFRKRPPRETRLVVRAEGLEVEQARAGKVSRREKVTGQELLGISFAPSLGHDRSAKFEAPSLRLICRRGRVVTARPPGLDHRGRHLRDLLIAATLRLRRAHPELGLPVEPQRPGRCPRCARAHVMGPGILCPSCGSWAGAFR